LLYNFWVVESNIYIRKGGLFQLVDGNEPDTIPAIPESNALKPFKT
jgi:hypothetical protein